MTDKSLLKADAFEVTERFLTLTKDLKEQQAAERVQPTLRQYQLGLFRLVVVGEIKKGKSSFINALLGEPDLLPTLSDVATSTVYKIMYGGAKKYKVFFLPKDPEKPKETLSEPLEVSPERIAEYGTEDGNPKNKKGVDFIGVQLPHPLLKSGVTIIDTPGLGGLFREHSDITWRYVPSADAIFFVLDSVEAVASKAEMEYLQRLRKMTSLLFFVQTKIDLAGTAQWQGWRDRNLDIIASTLEIPKEKLIYFPVSSELKRIADEEKSPKDLNESGFVPLLYFFHEKLLKTKEERLARALLSRIALEVTNIRRVLNDKRQVLNIESKEAFDALEREINEAKASFEKWRGKEYQQVIREFQDASTDLKRQTSERLQTTLDPSPQGSIIRPILDGLKQSQCGSSALVEQAGTVQSACLDLCSQQIFEIQGKYNQKMKELIASVLQKIGKSSRALELGTTVKGATVPLVERLDIHFSGFEKARNTFFGSTAGSSMAWIAAGIIFPPAAAIAALVGSIAGLLYSYRDLEKRREEQAMGKLQGILVDTVRQAQKQATQQFNATSTEFERAARDSFEAAATETQKELQDKLASIADARKSAREENLNKAVWLNERVKQADKILADIGKMAGRRTETAV